MFVFLLQFSHVRCRLPASESGPIRFPRVVRRFGVLDKLVGLNCRKEEEQTKKTQHSKAAAMANGKPFCPLFSFLYDFSRISCS
ncbi:hypothetical protein H6P81_007907 [Aristolochia fimbriata]|uniref:Secreted protein n=1 Tax=Aristolochia fimbriata TaxID=158543 RepID=A0AAV7F1S4_ARIFI|nr:hypothetical protein H6P81_007907 [Aristolochia fimbriata]